MTHGFADWLCQWAAMFSRWSDSCLALAAAARQAAPNNEA